MCQIMDKYIFFNVYNGLLRCTFVSTFRKQESKMGEGVQLPPSGHWWNRNRNVWLETVKSVVPLAMPPRANRRIEWRLNEHDEMGGLGAPSRLRADPVGTIHLPPNFTFAPSSCRLISFPGTEVPSFRGEHSGGRPRGGHRNESS